MTMSVKTTAVRAATHRARRRKPLHHAARAWHPVRLAGTPIRSGGIPLATAGTPAAGAATVGNAPAGAAPTSAAPAVAPPAAAEPAVEMVKSPEYDGQLDIGAVAGDISSGVTGDMVGGHVADAVGSVLNQDRFPVFGTKFGSVVPAKVAGAITGEVTGLVGTAVTDAVHALMHHKGEDGKPDAGFHWTPTPANKLVARFVKGVATTWTRALITEALAPPPPPNQTPMPSGPGAHAVAPSRPGAHAVAPSGPVAHTVAPSVPHVAAPMPQGAPGGHAPAPHGPPPPPLTPIPAAPPRLVAMPGSKHLVLVPGHGPTNSNNPPRVQPPGPAIDVVRPALPALAPLAQAGAVGLIGTAISAVYDQVAGPLVQRAVNAVTGRADEPITPPKPLTPGGLANGFVDGVLGGLLVRSVGDITFGPGKATPFGVSLGSSIVNNIVGAAWNTVYSRGVGPAIEKGVNQLAGIRSKDEQAKDVLSAGEQFSRAATRGVAAGATTFLVGKALWAPIMQLGMSVGGVGGLFIAIAGSSLIGAISGGLVDATVGPMLGKLGGNIYTWITGKPSYEQRHGAPATAPGPTPGSPTNAPNGNPGTIPAPAPGTPAPAPAPAPAPPAPAPGSPAPGPGPAPGSPTNAPNGNPGTVPASIAPAAPKAGARKKRKLSWNKAVDATSPSAKIGPAKLAKIAVRAG
ncbi:MAG: hypothetical protein JWN41_1707 [Thermoleophilia bacterium]|nr:hypothetical protein [Thermoleophilia bacterium]